MQRRRSRVLLLVSVSLAIVATIAALDRTGRLKPLLLGPGTPAGAPGETAATFGDAGAPPASSGKKVHPQAAPLSSAQLGAPLVNGAFVTACGAPSNMKVTVKATVKMGRANDVDVQTNPPDTAVCRCVEDATRAMRWDVSARTDHVTVRY